MSTGKLPLEGLLVFLGKKAVELGGIVKRGDRQLSYVLPITQADFAEMLNRVQNQPNMIARTDRTRLLVPKLADEESGSTFRARIFVGIHRLRNAAFPDPAKRQDFDKAYEFVVTELLNTRETAENIRKLFGEHARKVTRGEVARVQGQNLYIDENIDKELRRQTEDFLNSAVRVLKQGMQNVAQTLGVNIGFLFKNSGTFAGGVAGLHASDTNLAEYLQQTRQWSERLVQSRNQMEHKASLLPKVKYSQTTACIEVEEPRISSQPLSEFLLFIVDRLTCFVEEVTAHCLQACLPGSIAVTEVSLAQRDPENPVRFRLTLKDGGSPAWTIAYHEGSFEQASGSMLKKKLARGKIRLTATDLANHLACRHLTTLDLQVAQGRRAEPKWAAPNLAVIRERGERHEQEYLTHLRAQGTTVENLSHIPYKEEQRLLNETLALMERGAEVIAHGALGDGEWFGRPDVLLRVPTPGKRCAWSYEVADTKLAEATKATTILQLSLYSELLGKVQGTMPKFLWVVPPGKGFAGEKYRVSEYAAYYRYVRDRLRKAVTEERDNPTYPEPVEHCNICKWFHECDAQRRADDHLSLVADIRRQQRDQFEAWNAGTVAKLAALPIPLKERPRHGSEEPYESRREQARVQVEARTQNTLKYELLPIVEGMGLCQLPEPSAGDVFMDFEGDPFVGEQGLQYLFGLGVRKASGELVYEKRWALNREEEKEGFEWLVDEIMWRREADPKMHVYHFGGYEPGTMKRLMGRHTTREDEIDRMLRAGVLVDLHQAFKQGVRASVEEYSLKKIEAFYGFERRTPLEKARTAMRYLEHRLELDWRDEKLPEEIREVMEGYSHEDCISTAKLRDWLEAERQRLVEDGAEVPRFVDREGRTPEELDEAQKRVAALVAKLTTDVPANAGERTEEQQARWLLAQLQNWHRREDKAMYWEGYRLAGLDDADLLEDRAGLAGLKFLKRLLVERKIPVDRYTFEKQETEARAEKELYCKGEKFGTVLEIDSVRRVIDIKKTKKTADLHPTAVYLWDRPLSVKEHAEALFRIGDCVATNGIDAAGKYRAGRDLLLRKRPRLPGGETPEPLAGESSKATACRVVSALKDSVFAIQGPPGAGKTFTGARMICELVRQGKRIGITALSHKVIRQMLEEVVDAANEAEQEGVRCMQRSDDEKWTEDIATARKNEEAWAALETARANVVGGASWLWTPEAAFEAVDVLFIDEAGQMGLADMLAVSQAAKSLVLIGDPQQLERPLKGSHPDGAEKSALEHLLGDHKTIPPDMGFLLPRTWRLHPKICDFTSELFYEDRLQSEALTHSRVLEGHPWLKGAGLWFVPVEHEGNRNSSAEEVELVARLVKGLLRPEVKWFSSAGRQRRLKQEDILIVAPYNAQVADLSARLPDVKIGTVDKFQGQEEALVIYSLTTSSPEDAPRGMEFLYSLNRLNVATSRAKTAVIVVGNPRLFEPECRSPRQMQLANALCRYREMAVAMDASTI